MTKGNVSLDFRLKKVDKTRSYLLEEKKRNDLMSEKDKKVCNALNYLKNHCFCFCCK